MAGGKQSCIPPIVATERSVPGITDYPSGSVDWITGFGVVALTFMMLMYALEHRGRRFILAFAAGCAASSVYGFVSGAWPFGAVEAIWTAIAVRRYMQGPEPRHSTD